MKTPSFLRKRISHILSESELIGTEMDVFGWVKTARCQKQFSFVQIGDGSCHAPLQLVIDASVQNFDRLQTGYAIHAYGKIVKSPSEGQPVEMHVTELTILGEAPSTYPLQKKRHSFEFLRTIPHLRGRTNTFSAITRVRNALAYATHQFFQEHGFFYIQTPIITAADCEGAGELFRVTTAKIGEEKYEAEKDFFARETFLTVSGQLNGEALSLASGNIYTFGPTFRAENSNTSRHLAEFWMIEPEMAFADLDDNMTLAEKYLKYLISYVMNHNYEDLQFFHQFIERTLLDKLNTVITSRAIRLSYTEAIAILEKAQASFEFPVRWGIDLASEHERYLTEKHFRSPVIVYNYPKEIKAFYMRNNDDGKTVAAMDLLVPGIGELIGGSAREERMNILIEKMREFSLNPSDYEWYLDLRRYGSAPHAGFGLGFERLVQYVTGMENIRDVSLFPRYPGHCQY